MARENNLYQKSRRKKGGDGGKSSTEGHECAVDRGIYFGEGSSDLREDSE